jgi:putative sigma-54 modulation protein
MMYKEIAVDITVNTRHMDASESVKAHVEAKVSKLEHFYDSIQNIEVILDKEADKFVVEIIAHAKMKHTFVASHHDDNMHACIDMCLDKIVQQLRRHKDKVRDRQGPSHSQTVESAE